MILLDFNLWLNVNQILIFPIIFHHKFYSYLISAAHDLQLIVKH